MIFNWSFYIQINKKWSTDNEGNSKNLFVSSTKSSIGHLLGAAGSVEAIFSILALGKKTLPATLNLHDPIDSGNINLIANEPINKNVKVVLSNSFGFGGTNASLLLGKLQ